MILIIQGALIMQIPKTQTSDDGLKKVLFIPSDAQKFNVTFLRKFQTDNAFKTIATIQIQCSESLKPSELAITISEFLETGFFNFRGVCIA